MADEEEEESDWSLREVEEELRSNYTTLSNLIFFSMSEFLPLLNRRAEEDGEEKRRRGVTHSERL